MFVSFWLLRLVVVAAAKEARVPRHSICPQLLQQHA
jgi:hypothetical protein